MAWARHTHTQSSWGTIPLFLPIIASQSSHDATQRGRESQLHCVGVKACSPDPTEEWIHLHVSGAFPVPGTRGTSAADSKQEWACWRRTRGRSTSTIFLDVSAAVCSRFMTKHPHFSVDEKHRHLEEYHCTVCSLFCSWSYGTMTFLFLRAVNIFLFGGYMP